MFWRSTRSSLLPYTTLFRSKILEGPAVKFEGDRQAFLEDLRQALLAAKMVSYAQGYELMREAAREFGWHLNYGGIALMWRGGCIIRSAFLDNIKQAYDKNPELNNLLLDDYFKDKLHECQAGWRRLAASAITSGIPRSEEHTSELQSRG